MTDWTCWRDPSHTTISTTLFGWPQCSVCRAAPAFHERPAYLHSNFVLGIYVPLDRARSMIAPRSGVVGLPDGGDGEDDWTNVYYEGWVNGPMQYAGRDVRGLWEAGVEHAASRMVTSYPTVAQAHFPSKLVKCIGLYNPAAKTFNVHDEETLNAWLNQ